MNQQAIDRLVQEARLRRLARPAWDQTDRLLAASLKDLRTIRKILEIDEARAFDVAYRDGGDSRGIRTLEACGWNDSPWA